MELRRYLHFLLIITILKKASTEKIYLRSVRHSFIGISNLWDVDPSSTYSGGLIWNHDRKMNNYQFCFNKNSILRTEFYPIPEFVSSVYADVTVTSRKCDIMENAPSDCEENIGVGAYLNDSKILSHNIYPQSRDFILIPSINITKDFSRWTETIEFLGGKKYIQFLFNSKNSCGALINFASYYYNCTKLSSLATFESVLAPTKNNGTKRVIGQCVTNSKSLTNELPYIDCTWDGTGTVVGSCTCNKGFTNISSQCIACDVTEFKTSDGNVPCEKCGTDSTADNNRLSCPCKNNFYREKGKEREYKTSCYELPPPPEIINQTVSSTELYLKWKQDTPYSNGEEFIIDCRDCPKNDIFPVETPLKESTIRRLGAFTVYNLRLKFQNDITKLIGKEIFTDFNVTTKPGKPGAIQNLRQKINSDGSITLKWDPPFAKGNDKPTYIISYGTTSARTTNTEYTIKSHTLTRTFKVKVVVEVVVNGITLKGPSYTFEEEVEVKGGVSLNIAIGAITGVVIFVVIVAIISFCIWRKRNPPYLQVVRMLDGTVKLPGRFYNGSKLYVDPTTYNNVDDAVQNVAFEIHRKSLTIGKLLNGGEFADVYKGTLFKNGKSKDVAIKTLKPGASKHDRDDFLSEAAIIGQFSDPNVIMLEGVVLTEDPNVIVLEYMANGALDKFLQAHDKQLTNLQLFGMARGVASGMKYLSELGFIHRHLAARNILVDEHRTCKVCDFGMSREIKVDETYETQGGKIPVRWTAPEAIHYKKFTTASDIWSYGILLWELMSYGERPYWDWGNCEVLKRLNKGYRLPPPMNCPKVIYDLMLNCWNKDRTKRPKMNEIQDQLERWIRNPNIIDVTNTYEKVVFEHHL